MYSENNRVLTADAETVSAKRRIMQIIAQWVPGSWTGNSKCLTPIRAETVWRHNEVMTPDRTKMSSTGNIRDWNAVVRQVPGSLVVKAVIHHRRISLTIFTEQGLFLQSVLRGGRCLSPKNLLLVRHVCQSWRQVLKNIIDDETVWEWLLDHKPLFATSTMTFPPPTDVNYNQYSDDHDKQRCDSTSAVKHMPQVHLRDTYIVI